MTINKQFLLDSISFAGLGVHSGLKVKATIYPEYSGGLCFLRKGVRIPAHYENLKDARFGLILEKDGVSVRTVEHFLAAMTALGIWEATVEVEGPELPLLDGSAAPIVEQILAVGLQDSGQIIEPLVIKEELSVEMGTSNIRLDFSDKFYLDVIVDYPHPQIGLQKWSGLMNNKVFLEQIAYARTFGFLKDESFLKAEGYALGATLENSVIFNDTEVMNAAGLRDAKEPVRHKVLDLLGDLSLLGRPICGRVSSFRGGHSLSMKLLSKIIRTNF